MNPRYPVYVISKGRWESRLTAKALENMGVPYHMVVEAQELEKCAAVVDPAYATLLILDPAYQKDYDTCDDLGGAKGKGPGPARNFAWDHAVSTGVKFHWVMDDNIRKFYRLNRNLKVPVACGTIFWIMEDIVESCENVIMAGPNYYMFASRKSKLPFCVRNTRIYSCNLIKNDAPYRWRGRYNEDTDLSLRMLKDGFCTIQFNAFLQQKMTTMTMRGGNTDELYQGDGRLKMAEMLVKLHPDVARLVWRYNRWHHHVDYRLFKRNELRFNPDFEFPEEIDDYGMVLETVGEGKA